VGFRCAPESFEVNPLSESPNIGLLAVAVLEHKLTSDQARHILRIQNSYKLNGVTAPAVGDIAVSRGYLLGKDVDQLVKRQRELRVAGQAIPDPIGGRDHKNGHRKLTAGFVVIASSASLLAVLLTGYFTQWNLERTIAVATVGAVASGILRDAAAILVLVAMLAVGFLTGWSAGGVELTGSGLIAIFGFLRDITEEGGRARATVSRLLHWLLLVLWLVSGLYAVSMASQLHACATAPPSSIASSEKCWTRCWSSLVIAGAASLYFVAVAWTRRRELWYFECRQDLMVACVDRAVRSIETVPLQPGPSTAALASHVDVAIQDVMEKTAHLLRLGVWQSALRQMTPASTHAGAITLWYIALGPDLQLVIEAFSAPGAPQSVLNACECIRKSFRPSHYDPDAMARLRKHYTIDGRLDREALLRDPAHRAATSIAGWVYATRRGRLIKDVQATDEFDRSYLSVVPGELQTPEVRRWLNFRMAGAVPVYTRAEKGRTRAGIVLAFRNLPVIAPEDWNALYTSSRLIGALLDRRPQAAGRREHANGTPGH